MVSRRESAKTLAFFERQLLVEILASALRRGKTPERPPLGSGDTVTGRAVSYIEANLFSDLSLAAIARHAFASASTLLRHFRDDTSKSPHGYIKARRGRGATTARGRHARRRRRWPAAGISELRRLHQTLRRVSLILPEADARKLVMSGSGRTVLAACGDALFSSSRRLRQKTTHDDTEREHRRLITASRSSVQDPVVSMPAQGATVSLAQLFDGRRQNRERPAPSRRVP